MIPAALIATPAISRLGAIHAVVFGGFAPASLAQRIKASQPVAVLTASRGIDGAKPPMSYKPYITEAIELSSSKPSKTIILATRLIVLGPCKQRRWPEKLAAIS